MAILSKYGWKHEFGYLHGADANIIKSEWDGVASSNGTGEANAEDMVNFAQNNPNSEWHKVFDWNNVTAAHNWRKVQARQVMSNLIEVKIEIDEDNNKSNPIEIPVLFNTDQRTTADCSGYKPRQIILTQASEMDKLTDRAKEALKDWCYAYDIVTDPTIVGIKQYIQSKI